MKKNKQILAVWMGLAFGLFNNEAEEEEEKKIEKEEEEQ